MSNSKFFKHYVIFHSLTMEKSTTSVQHMATIGTMNGVPPPPAMISTISMVSVRKLAFKTKFAIKLAKNGSVQLKMVEKWCASAWVMEVESGIVIILICVSIKEYYICLKKNGLQLMMTVIEWFVLVWVMEMASGCVMQCPTVWR